MEYRLPLTYFIGVRRSVYKPVYPVYVAGEDAAPKEFILSFSGAEVGIDFSSLSAPEKVYAARMTKQRLHQPLFVSRSCTPMPPAARCVGCAMSNCSMPPTSSPTAKTAEIPSSPTGWLCARSTTPPTTGTSSGSPPSWWSTSTKGCLTRSMAHAQTRPPRDARFDDCRAAEPCSQARSRAPGVPLHPIPRSVLIGVRSRVEIRSSAPSSGDSCGNETIIHLGAGTTRTGRAMAVSAAATRDAARIG